MGEALYSDPALARTSPLHPMEAMGQTAALIVPTLLMRRDQNWAQNQDLLLVRGQGQDGISEQLGEQRLNELREHAFDQQQHLGQCWSRRRRRRRKYKYGYDSRRRRK